MKRKLSKLNRYRCKHCGEVFKRRSSKRWVKSYCAEYDRTVHLILQPKG